MVIIRKIEELIEHGDKTVKEKDVFLPKRRKIVRVEYMETLVTVPVRSDLLPGEGGNPGEMTFSSAGFCDFCEIAKSEPVQ